MFRMFMSFLPLVRNVHLNSCHPHAIFRSSLLRVLSLQRPGNHLSEREIERYRLAYNVEGRPRDTKRESYVVDISIDIGLTLEERGIAIVEISDT